MPPSHNKPHYIILQYSQKIKHIFPMRTKCGQSPLLFRLFFVKAVFFATRKILFCCYTTIPIRTKSAVSSLIFLSKPYFLRPGRFYSAATLLYLYGQSPLLFRLFFCQSRIFCDPEDFILLLPYYTYMDTVRCFLADFFVEAVFLRPGNYYQADTINIPMPAKHSVISLFLSKP